MQFTKLDLPEVVRIDLQKNEDSRGFFARLLCKNELLENSLANNLVQFNNTLTKEKGTIRGLHFQRPPKAETKFVRCISGAVFDVAVDLRKGSKTFGSYCALELSSDNRAMIAIPPGFAHGFQTLSSNVELIYFHTEFYSPELEGGVSPLDSSISIRWPLESRGLSDRDLSLPQLSDLEPIKI